MNTYEIRYQLQTGEYVSEKREAVDSGRAIVTWRRANPTAKLIWMKRMDGLAIVPDRRLPSEPD